jgi:predicted NBD/HSP70 family sugar kinase
MPTPARGPAIVRNINRFDVLHAIRLHDNEISRSKIAELTGLSQATISSIVSHLIQEGALIEEGASQLEIRGRGRPLVSLRLRPEYMFVAGVKIATHQIVVSLTDFIGNICASDNIECEPFQLGPEKLAVFVAKAIRACLRKVERSVEEVSGVGIGLPGYVGLNSGMVYWSPVFKERNVQFGKIMQSRFDVPVFIENDANLVTLAEHWFGLAKGLEHAVVITIEHGTGSGLILNGKLYRGATGLAAEFGHTKLVFEGPLCQCGQHGCMETRTAGFAILQEAAKAGFHVPEQPLDYHERFRLLNQVLEYAEAGDRKLRRIFHHMGRYLGLGIANVINLLNPQRVIVCEGAFRCAHLYEETMRATIDEKVLPPLKINQDIMIHHWGDEVWARGAASLVLQELDQRGDVRRAAPANAAKRRRKSRRTPSRGGTALANDSGGTSSPTQPNSA